MTTLTQPRLTPTRRWITRHPQWWTGVVAGLGWVALAWLQLSDGHAGHVGHQPPGSGSGFGFGSVAGIVLPWLAMIGVMLPLVWGNLQYAALRSPARRRLRVTFVVVSGWAAAWAVAALALASATTLIAVTTQIAVTTRIAAATPTIGAVLAALLTGLIALVWQSLPLRRRALARCHRRYAPPLREPAQSRGCRAYGRQLGWDCVLACGPMMLAMAAAGHHVLAAVAMVGLAWYERRRPHHDPARLIPPLVLLATGGAGLALAWID